VEPLIKALKDEECYREATEALKKITALDFGTDHGLWLEWWRNWKEGKPEIQ
jgi:hypothetical protein